MKNKKLIIFIILLVIMIILFILANKSYISNFFQDDFIFFKIFHNSDENNQIKTNSKYFGNNNYIFDVRYENLQIKNVNLGNTINQKTLVKEKVAPGTQGYFNIILKANRNSKYKIEFVSKNTKPQNLVFYLENSESKYSSLEELEKLLVGNIKSSTQKLIKINWIWEYSLNNMNDIVDTKDGQSLNKYNFDIYVIGEE